MTSKVTAETRTVSGVTITAEKREHDNAVCVILRRGSLLTQTPYAPYDAGMAAYYATVKGVRDLEDKKMLDSKSPSL